MAQIITFYSYKGGTGRSMSMANVAWILASQRKKVLMIDWDLEAPGLHRYFSPFLVDPTLSASPGIIDFLRNFAVQSAKVQAAKTANDPERPPDWYREHADITDYALSLRWPHFRPGTLDLVPAGKQDADYATRVNSFNFDHFYSGLGGGAFLEAAKEYMEVYDYVLIDSRTGVSDTSGICTVQMPETVVICFTMSNQGIDGAANVAESIARQRTDRDGRTRVRILPVPMRTDPFEKDKLARRTNYAKERFARFLEPLGPEYWKTVEVQYVPYYVYEEVLATFGDRRNESRTSILGAYEGLTKVITRGDVSEMLAPSEDERVQVLAKFEAILNAEVPTAEAAPVAALSPYAHDLYLSYSPQDEAEAAALAKNLAARSLAVVNGQRLITDPAWPDRVTDLLKRSRAFALAEGRVSVGSWPWREYALAVAHQRSERAQGREFPLLSLALSARSSSATPAWNQPNQFDFSGKVEPAAYDAFVQRLVKGQLTAIAPTQTPFKGFEPYEESDAPLFFGRDADLEKLTAYVASNRVGFLRGATGCGKTSLVQSGLKPHLRRQGQPVWEVVSLVPGRNPFFDLAAALSPLLNTDRNESTRVVDTTRLAQSFREAGGDIVRQLLHLVGERPPRLERFLLVVDQAENLFGVSDEREREAFLNLVAQAAELNVHVLFVVSPECEAHWLVARPDFAEALSQGYLLQGLNARQMEDMHTGLAALTGQAQPYLTAEAVADWAEDPARLPLFSQWLSEGVPFEGSEAFAGLWLQRYIQGPESLKELLLFVETSEGGFRERSILWKELDADTQRRLQPLKAGRLLVVEPGEEAANATVRLLHGPSLLTSPEMIESLKACREALEWRTGLGPRAAAWVEKGWPAEVGATEEDRQLARRFSLALTTSERDFIEGSNPLAAIVLPPAAAAPVVPMPAGRSRAAASALSRPTWMRWAIGLAALLAALLIIGAGAFWMLDRSVKLTSMAPMPAPMPAQSLTQLLRDDRYNDATAFCQEQKDLPLMECAYAYRGAGNFDRAIELYEKAVVQFPDNARNFADLAYAQALKAKTPADYGKAVENLQKAVDKSPSDAGLRVELGGYLILVGRTPDALSSFDAALKIDPLLQSAQGGRRKALEILKPGPPERVAQVQTPAPLTVYLQIPNETRRIEAATLQAVLQKLGYNAQGSQVVGDKAPKQNEVRFSAKEDAIRAGRLVEDLRKAGFEAGAPKLMDWLKKPVPNVIEVWFSRMDTNANKMRQQAY